MKVEELISTLQEYSPTVDVSLTLLSAKSEGLCEAIHIEAMYTM